ncbi:MAG: V-type ATP synthase subunit F [Ruminococcaceae bacterium]|nr:V-type ATP synthase subunit F [Oscillospiraceae bacterium]
MYKIAVIGDSDSICGFSAIGMTAMAVSDEKEALEKLRALDPSVFAVVFVTENVYGLIAEEYDRENAIPAVIPIPGTTGNTGAGMRDVSKFVEMAVGSDIIS